MSAAAPATGSGGGACSGSSGGGTSVGNGIGNSISSSSNNSNNNNSIPGGGGGVGVTNGGSGGIGSSAAGGGSGSGINSLPTTGRLNNNISVTSINCEIKSTTNSAAGQQHSTTATPGNLDLQNGQLQQHQQQHQVANNSQYFGNVGVRITVPKMEESDESDTELSNIEKIAKVNMRNNRKQINGGAGDNNSMSSGGVNAPRPMSWEGELSENEEMMMDVDNNSSSCSSAQTTMTQLQSLPSNNNSIPTSLISNHHLTDNAMSSSSSSSLTSSSITNTSTTNQTAGIGITNLSNKLLSPDAIKPELGTISLEATSSYLNNNNNTNLNNNNSNKQKYPDIVNLKYEPGLHDNSNGINSPLLVRSKNNLLPANPSPDSAIHSVYTHSSPSQSPLTSRHAPYTPSLSRNNSDASHSSCYSYSSEFSPTHSPIQGRHPMYGGPGSNSGSGGGGGNVGNGSTFNGSPLHHTVLYRPMLDNTLGILGGQQAQQQQQLQQQHSEDSILEGETLPSAGISRQQLINSPCPICGDKISGFHYGIFSCESCKGFFKRTVQNRKNYVCLRGAACPVTIATRKKCPACRFDKCLQKGMKLEAIREDRTRGGRSTYQCSYTLPGTMLSPSISAENSGLHSRNMQNGTPLKTESNDAIRHGKRNGIPPLLQEIMDVEHLWQYNEVELSRLNQPPPPANNSSFVTNPLLASAGLANGENSNPDLIANLCNIADHRLYKIVKWCKSLPLFKNISIDDQICLLINSWCELLLFSCCFRSMSTPGEIRISLGKTITLAQAKHSGLQNCIERMLNLTDHLRRLRVDRYEYVAMKVIVLLSSDTSDLKESEKVRASQEKALQALQAYTLTLYPDSPAKFGELLLRIPELQRTCQVGKEMLTIKPKEGEEPSFNLLMELLRGEH